MAMEGAKDSKANVTVGEVEEEEEEEVRIDTNNC